MKPTFSFTLTGETTRPDERDVLAGGLAASGLDATVWPVLDAMARTGTPNTTPKVLRAFLDGRLAGLAYILECRRIGRCFFDVPVASVIDMAPMPMFCWTRNGALIDSHANAGFVAAGLDPHAFYTAAIGYLTRRYLYGSVMDMAADPAAGPHASSALFDCGHCRLDEGASVDAFLDRSGSLRRKLNKFRNKGGTVEVLRGAMPPQVLAEAMGCYATLTPLALLPFQDNYVAMSAATASLSSDRLVHVVCRLGGALAGYHSFVICGRTMHCLSGAFDRTRHSTFHAYEVLIVESLRVAIDHHVRQIDYGAVLNETKARMMDTFSRTELRIYSRFAAVRGAMRLVVGRSKVRPETFAAFTGLDVDTTLNP
jgi:hypothetical protein